MLGSGAHDLRHRGSSAALAAFRLRGAMPFVASSVVVPASSAAFRNVAAFMASFAIFLAFMAVCLQAGADVGEWLR